MAVDVAPDLNAQIMKDLRTSLSKDRRLRALFDKLAEGKADYEDAHKVSQIAGEHATAALQKALRPDVLPDRRLYYNIAERTLKPAIEYADGVVDNFTQIMQTKKNQRAGMNIKAVRPRQNTETIDNLCGLASDYEDFEDGRWVLDKPVQTTVENVVDRFVRVNAAFASRSGLHPTMIRIAEVDCCPWCSGLDGVFDFGSQPAEFYARHNNCRCTTDYSL